MLKAAFVLVTVLFSLVSAQQQCGSINVGGNSFNLQALAAATSINANIVDKNGNALTFEFGVCHAIAAPCPLQDGSGFPSACPNGNQAGVCQEWAGGSGTACCGQATTLVVGAIANGLSLTYSGGDNCNGCTSARNTVIHIVCDATKTAVPQSSDITVTLPDSTQINIVPTYIIAFSHSSACVGGSAPGGPYAPGTTPPGGISAGSVMLIIIFVGFFVYMVAGILIQKFKFEQEGARIIPNYDFWSDLPFLIKDGFRFLINKCTGNAGGYTTVKDQP
jgi:hypothetical protein